MNMHESVLLHESLEALQIRPEGHYVDATFGRGGHSGAILKALGPAGRLLAIDRDPDAIRHAQKAFATDERIRLWHGSFADLGKAVSEAGMTGKVDGVLFDLGVSSPQLDNPERGFSFLRDGPLDMRMDTTGSYSAKTFVNTASVEDMTRIFRELGEERYAGRIARAIAEARAQEPLGSTLQLAEIVKAANPRWEQHKHPATRVFQAIRMHVNRELESLQQGLESAVDVLAPGGRLVVISFHSLEDRMVKEFMRYRERGADIPREIPVLHHVTETGFRRVGKAVKAGSEEVAHNIRARSAIMRTGERST